MPEEWAKAFSPTMALERCTCMPLMRATMREVRTISRVLILSVTSPNCPARVRRAMMTSSRATFPARSPMPLMVPSTCRAPARTAARELATARPRSLWQWTEMTALPMFGTFSLRWRMMR